MRNKNIEKSGETMVVCMYLKVFQNASQHLKHKNPLTSHSNYIPHHPQEHKDRNKTSIIILDDCITYKLIVIGIS